MTDESRVFVGHDVNGVALHVGDEVQVIDHPSINPKVVGLTRTVHSARLRYPTPDFLLKTFGDEGWFEAVTEEGKCHGLHASVVQKKESA